MRVRDVIELSKIRLKNIAVSKDDSALIKLLNMGVCDLYNKFNLRIKSETIKTNTNLSLYELRSSDVSLLLTVYDLTGRELKQSDVLNSKAWEYKMVNYRSFILNHPQESAVYALYKASPDMLSEMSEWIDVPDAMLEALLLYMAYTVNATITSPMSTMQRGGGTEADFLYKRYQDECQSLENQGYRIPLDSETLSIRDKGYV